MKQKKITIHFKCTFLLVFIFHEREYRWIVGTAERIEESHWILIIYFLGGKYYNFPPVFPFFFPREKVKIIISILSNNKP